MKPFKLIIAILLMLVSVQSNAQFLKKLGKKAQQAAERALERKIEEKSEMETEKSFDSVFNNETRAEKRRRLRKLKKQQQQNGNSDNDNPNDPVDTSYDELVTSAEENLEVYRIYGFEPGATILFEDTFEDTSYGDFPAKWDTNGSGEIVEINGEKWFRLGGNSKYIPMTARALPANYTVSFDLHSVGLDKKTSSNAYLTLLLEDNTGFQQSKNWCMTELSVCQFIGNLGVVEKVENGKRQIRNQIGKDYRDQVNGKSRISISVNKTRFRVWLNDNKLIDVPRLIPEGANVFKLYTRGLRDTDGIDELYISNFLMTEIGKDNRSKLITEGRLSTNAILFESASAELKGQSYGEIAKIAQVLKDNPEVKVQIVGHTDGDGPEDSNRMLSRKRADAVKQALITAYGIDSARMQTDGMGESQPIAENSTPAGKAQNRRVEFIKI